MKSLYVGKVPHQAAEDDLQEWFGQAGFRVTKVSLIRDLFSRASHDFGFIEITNHEEAERAIRSLDGKSFLGSHGGSLGWKK